MQEAVAVSSDKLYSTGVDFIDQALDGGLQPGALTLVYGTTGVGKTQLGLSFCNQGLVADGHRGLIVDMATRGDDQQQAEYASRLFGWELHNGAVNPGALWDFDEPGPDLLQGLGYSGNRVTRADMSEDEWHEWRARLARRLDEAATCLYYRFVRGTRRMIVDGLEPAFKTADSVQLQLFEFIYQRVLHTDSDWVARSLFRGKWLEYRDRVQAHTYDNHDIATMLLQTASEVMLDDMLARNYQDGDLAINASTIILLGRCRFDTRITRAAFVLKHRGRSCSEDIIPYTITDAGLVRA